MHSLYSYLYFAYKKLDEQFLSFLRGDKSWVTTHCKISMKWTPLNTHHFRNKRVFLLNTHTYVRISSSKQVEIFCFYSSWYQVFFLLLLFLFDVTRAAWPRWRLSNMKPIQRLWQINGTVGGINVLNTFTFYVIPQHWYDIGSWNPFSSKTMIYLFYIANIMAADVLAMQGAKASTAML